MRKILRDSLPALLIVMAFLFSCKEKSKPTANMHAAHGPVNDSLAALVKPTDELVISTIETVKALPGARFSEMQLRGIVNYNTNNLNSVSSRVSGRIERLYIKYNYQQVTKGQKLMDIYSPDLINAQQELIFLYQNNEPELLESAKRKLRLLGATDLQINQALKSGKANYTISVYSPYSGYISEVAPSNAAAAPQGSTMISSAGESSSMGGMGGSSGSAATPAALPEVASSSPLLLREGQYVALGQMLFNLVNPDLVWAEFYVHPDQLKEFKQGTRLRVQSVDDKSKEADVSLTLIQPYYNAGVDYSVARAVLPNSSKKWKVGELLNVGGAEGIKKEGDWLPRTAVLQLGTRYVVFTKRKEGFVPEYVQVKAIMGDWVDVANMEGKEVAVNAWFLVDSESFIDVKNIKEQ